MRFKLIVFLIISNLVLFIFTIFQLGQSEYQRSPYLVGVLSSNDLRLIKYAGLKEGLVKYGFNLENDIHFLVKNAQSERQTLLPLAEELVTAGVKVIVTTGRVETEVAKKVTKGTGIPVVFMGLTAIGEDNLVTNLLFPQEELTGVQNDHAALSGKRLELLKKLLPQINKVLIIYDPKVIPAYESLLAVENAAQKLDLQLELAAASRLADIETIFEKDRDNIDAILLLPSFFLESEGARELVPLAMKQGLPVMGVEHGTEARLFAVYGITPYEQGRQAARILAKILNGQNVEDIPVEPPSKLQLTVDLGVARQLNLKVAPAILGYAKINYENTGDNDENVEKY